MKIRLVSHASVITTGLDAAVLCDPWLFGKAFNDSWSLFPKAVWSEEWLDDIDFLWISHEHPDHLHFPTLASLPESWRKRVTVLYQDRGSDEVCTALRRLGFEKIRLLRHRQQVAISPSMSVYCYHAPYGDSCLAVTSEGSVCVNVNDAQMAEDDCRTMTRDLGHVDVALKQFSLAGYTGGKDYDYELRYMAESILLHIVDVHRWLESRVTIPFASFVYFSNRDNWFVNAYANRPVTAHQRLLDEGCDSALLYPGDEYDVEAPFDSTANIERFKADEPKIPELPMDEPPIVPVVELQEIFASFSADIHDKFTRKRINVLQPVHVRVPDLGVTLEMSIPNGSLESLGPDPMPAHLEVCSQALRFAFSARFGFETMSISSRVFVLNDRDWPWILTRDLLWLYRWGIWLKPEWLVSPSNLRRVWPWMRENKLNRTKAAEQARGAARKLRHRCRQALRRLTA